MQIVSIGDSEDNLHKISNPIYWEKYFKMYMLKILPKVLSIKCHFLHSVLYNFQLC